MLKAKFILFFVILFLVAVVLLQNTGTVTIRFLFWQLSASQILIAPLLVLAGFVMGLIAGLIITRHKRHGTEGPGGA